MYISFLKCHIIVFNTFKIWLKDAVQCQQCGLCCHKKCISKCQINTECLPTDKISMKSEYNGLNQSDVSINETFEEITINSENPAEPRSPQSMKRVNSVSNLTIPGMLHIEFLFNCANTKSVVSTGSLAVCSQSRSLPHSPQHSPGRKQSLINVNPFILCATALDEVQKNPAEASQFIIQLLEQIMTCTSDESLMDMAKETGQQLYVNISAEEKSEKINSMASNF